MQGQEQHVADLAANLSKGEIDLRGAVGQRFTHHLTLKENAAAVAEHASFKGQPGCQRAKQNFRLNWAKEQHDARVVVRKSTRESLGEMIGE